MFEDEITRRKALESLIKTIAIMAGVSTATVKSVFAQTRQVTVQKPNLATKLTETSKQRLLRVKASLPDAKALKVMLFPERRVYINEYGRPPQTHLKMDPAIGLVCTGYFSELATDIGINQGACTGNGCRVQTCGELTSCDGNKCGEQQCPKMGPCTGHTSILISTESISHMHNDPFVRTLFKELHVTTAADLSRELRTMLGLKRTLK